VPTAAVPTNVQFVGVVGVFDPSLLEMWMISKSPIAVPVGAPIENDVVPACKVELAR
jgi:hypothetical protein